MSAYGRLAQFPDAAALLDAAAGLRELGYTRIEAFSPFPVDGMPACVGHARTRMPLAMACAGLVGGAGTLAMQYVAAVHDYPIDVGGRPAASWPAFVPAAVEVAILLAVLAGFIAFLRGCRLPALYHPLFHVEWFEEASRAGFLLLLRADDPAWDDLRSATDMAALSPLRHAEVHR
ncbi:MAG: DUF3341 domain-containing protein [Luteibacter sp.]